MPERSSMFWSSSTKWYCSAAASFCPSVDLPAPRKPMSAMRDRRALMDESAAHVAFSAGCAGRRSRRLSALLCAHRLAALCPPGILPATAERADEVHAGSELEGVEIERLQLCLQERGL